MWNRIVAVQFWCNRKAIRQVLTNMLFENVFILLQEQGGRYSKGRVNATLNHHDTTVTNRANSATQYSNTTTHAGPHISL